MRLRLVLMAAATLSVAAMPAFAWSGPHDPTTEFPLDPGSYRLVGSVTELPEDLRRLCSADGRVADIGAPFDVSGADPQLPGVRLGWAAVSGAHVVLECERTTTSATSYYTLIAATRVPGQAASVVASLTEFDSTAFERALAHLSPGPVPEPNAGDAK
jgi:hypothetical protein